MSTFTLLALLVRLLAVGGASVDPSPADTRVHTPTIMPPGRVFLNSVELSLFCDTPLSRIYYTTDLTDPTVRSPVVPENTSAFSLLINTPGPHTVKAIAVAGSLIPSDMVLKRLHVFQIMSPPDIRPAADGRYDAPLNITVADPSVCSVDYLDLTVCYKITTNKLEKPVVCMSCQEFVLIEDIGTYSLSVYYSIDGLVVSETRVLKYKLTRPPFDTKPVHFRRDKPFQYKPKVDVFTVSKELNGERFGCSKRSIMGHHIILHNPLGHFNVLPPASGCGVGLSLPSDSSTTLADSFPKESSHRSFFRNPSYKSMVDKLSMKEISDWRRQYAAAMSQGSTSCTVATNAGFFDIHNHNCLGNLVSQRKVLQSSSNHNVNFGIKNGSFVIGYVDLKSEGKSSDAEDQFDTLISGLVWLVRGGKAYVKESVAPIEGTGKIGDGENMSFQTNGPNFVNILSARTAIGYDSFGRLMLAQVEGESYVRGMNLLEFADFLVELGFESAINLDGGGSATITAFDTLITEPSWKCTAEDYEAIALATDDDLPISPTSGTGPESVRVCEKPVSSITCIHAMPPPDETVLLPSQIETLSSAPSIVPSAPPSAAISRSSSPTLSPSQSTIAEVTATVGPLPVECGYLAGYVANMENELKKFQYATFGLAILLVIAMTTCGLWIISYNTLKREMQERNISAAVNRGPAVAQAPSRGRGAGFDQELEMTRNIRNQGEPRDHFYAEDNEYGLEDDFEAALPEGGIDSEDDDDETALMSPPPRRQDSRGGQRFSAGVNPFQRR